MHTPNFPEERLVARAQQGDDGAFAELVQRYYDRVYALVSARVGPLRAGAVAAEVFALAFRHVGEAEPWAFGGWLEALAARRADEHGPAWQPGRVAEPAVAYGRPGAAARELEPWKLIGEAEPDRVITLADYFQARRGFDTDEALAAACGVDPQRVRRIKHGAAADAELRQLLSDLAPVVRRLLAYYDPDAVPDWLEGNSPDLRGRRPIDVLREGNLPDVLAVLEAQTSGAFF